MFRKKPIAVIGGGDSAMEEATFLTKYGSKVYIIHRRDTLRASMVMQRRAQENPKIEFLWDSEVAEAHDNGDGMLGAITVRNLKSGDTQRLDVAGLFFAIGHEPATRFLEGQLKLDSDGYVVTTPGSTATSVRGVFAAGDVQDKKWRQAVTAAGTGALCNACDVTSRHWLQALCTRIGTQLHLDRARFSCSTRISDPGIKQELSNRVIAKFGSMGHARGLYTWSFHVQGAWRHLKWSIFSMRMLETPQEHRRAGDA